MKNIEEIHNINLEVLEYENYETALKSFVLFTRINDTLGTCKFNLPTEVFKFLV